MKIGKKLLHSAIIAILAISLPTGCNMVNADNFAPAATIALSTSKAQTPKPTPPPKAKGKTRIVTTCVKIRHQTLAENLKDWLKIVDKAGALNPDVILLSEAVYERGVGLSGKKLGEKIPGTLTNAMAKKAVKYNSYIVFSMFERVDEKTVFNTAVLIDRKGKIIGKYHKIHVHDDEIAAGVVPDDKYPVFKTDFGIVGLEICWDLVVPEIAQKLAAKGAQIILAPSIGDFWPDNSYVNTANFNGIYLAVSGQDVASPENKTSVIIDPDGKVLAGVSDPSSVEWPYKPGRGSVTYADIDMKAVKNIK
jgi:predicted amidohydrolase